MKFNSLFRAVGNRVSLFLTVAAVLTTAACSDDSPETPKEPEPGQEIVDPGAETHGTMTDANITGFVTDTDGKPIKDVNVVSGTHSSVTNEAGAFTFSKVDVNNGRSLIYFSKDGYFSVTRSASFSSEAIWNVVLVKKGSESYTATTTFEADESVEIVADGMQVEMKGGLKNRSTGKAYTGKVNADMLYLSPENEHFAEMMPGSDLSAVRTDNSTASLVSYGMTSVNLTDASGNPLQLADNAPATLTFPIPEGMEENPRPAIPLWSFDETTGQWVEEGEARLENGVYVGTVKHFSWVNLDWPEEQAVVDGKVKDANGNPVANQRVKIGQISVRTDSKGEFSHEVPAGIEFKVGVKSEWYGNYKPEVWEEIPALAPRQSYDVDITLPVIYTVSGRILSGKEPATAYVWLTCGGVDGETSVTATDGSFKLKIPAGFSGTAILNILSGSIITRDVTIGDGNVALGDIYINGSGSPEQGTLLSPEESKKYLEGVATDFLGLFNPADQQNLIELSNYFVNTYGDLDVPEDWGLSDDEEDEYYNAADVMKNVRRTLAGGNPAALSRAFDGVYDFSRFSGIYEPGEYAWRKTGESSDIIFRFMNAGGETCTVTAKGTGKDSSAEISGSTVSVPENVTVEVKEGSAVHVTANIRSSYDSGAHTASVTINAKAANIEVTATTDADDNRVTANSVLKISGKTVLTSVASVEGHDLCNISRIENILDDEDSEGLGSLFTKATAETDVLGRLQVRGDVKDFSEILDLENNYYDNSEGYSKDEAKALVEKDCQSLNANIIAGLYYNSNVMQAQLWFMPELDEEPEYEYWEWYFAPNLRFVADNTTYSFSDYFGNSRFASVEDQWTSLFDSYKRLWK